MKQKIISLISFVMLVVAWALPAAAQYDPTEDGFDPATKLITTATQLSSPASDSDEGTHIEYLIDDNISTFWHTDWHGTYSGAHYIQISLPEATTGYYQMVFGRRNSSNTCQATMMLVEQSTDGLNWTTVKTLELPWAGDDDQGKYVVSDFFRISEATHLRVTCTKTNTNTQTWHCAELQFYQADETAALIGAIDDLLARYDRYLPGYPEELSIGTGFGQYSDTQAWENFQAHMATANEYALTIYDGGEVSKEQIEEIVAQVENDFKAIMASLVTYSMADGYYRIVGGLKYYTEEETGETDLDGNPLTKKNYYDIAMYGTLDGWCYWGAMDNTDPRQLWHLSMVGKDVKMVNAATEMQCAGQVNANVTMSAEVDTLMGFDYVGTNENGKDIIYIRYSSQAKDYSGANSVYFHQQGHGQGHPEVATHKLCLWVATWNKGEEYVSDKGTSEWYLEPVPEEEVKALLEAYELVKNHDKLVLNYQDYIAKSTETLDLIKDLRNVYTPDTESPVITSTSQFHSLWTEVKEGSLDNLLDNDPNTFWHSAWSSGKATGPHQASLDVTVDEPLIGTYQLYILRRNIATDHMIRTSLYGTNEESALSETADTNWTLICDNVSTPWYSGQKDVYSQPFSITEPYKYLRFYEEDATDNRNQGYTNCGHYATFQLYPSTKVKTSQFDAMGEVAARLDSIVNASATMDLATLTVEQYNELVEAYETVKALTVDPTTLRNTISSNSKIPSYVKVGENPGYWTSDETGVALDNILKEATAYDDAGKYTQEQSDKYVEDILAAKAAIYSSAIGVDPNKWYHLQYDSEENFDANGWSKVSIAAGTLYDQRIGAGKRVENNVSVVLDTDSIKPGTELYYFEDNLVTNEEATQFRFVPLTDSTYAIQNRASGLFIYRKPLTTNGNISLQWTPSAFTVKPIGHGQNVLYMTHIDGTTISYPHLNAWESEYSFVGTWDDSHPGCNSGFLIMPVEDVDLESYKPERVMSRLAGDVTPICLPYDVATDFGSVYMPVGCFEQDGASFLGLVNISGEIEAGTPFFVIPEGEYDGTTAEDVYFYLGNKMTTNPKSQAGVYGTFVDKWIGTGYVSFVNNEAKGIEGEDTGRNFSVPAGQGYLVYGEVSKPEDVECDLAIQINGNFTDWTSINNAIQTVAKRGTVYNLNGQVVRQNATLNDVKSMGRGMYIINGVKVLVK